MKEAQQAVQEFHEMAQQTVSCKPTLPSFEDKILRLKLIREELSELEDALIDEDIVGVADGIGDAIYVLLGTAVTCGIDMEPIFAEIHRSNMTKRGGHRNEFGKWVKPSTYEPAKLIPILEQQGMQNGKGN